MTHIKNNRTEVIEVADYLKMKNGGGLTPTPIKTKSTKARDKAFHDLDLTLQLAGIPFEKEYKFSDERKFRFDRAIPFYKIGIEYEGILSEKSRHTNAKGYTNDAEKYNLAQSLGWVVFRYTALNVGQMITDVRNRIGFKL